MQSKSPEGEPNSTQSQSAFESIESKIALSPPVDFSIHTGAVETKYLLDDALLEIAPALMSPRVTDTTTPTEPPATPRRTAIIVLHGMGQQVPFETINGVARNLMSKEKKAHPESQHGMTVSSIKNGDTSLPRAQLTLTSNTGSRTVDVYEAYWAPLTEGAITLTQTVAFAFGAGIQALMNSFAPPRFKFNRWLFGCWYPFPIGFEIFAAYFVAIIVCAVMLVLNLLILGIAGSGIAGLGTFPLGEIEAPTRAQFTADLQYIAVPTIMYAFFMWLMQTHIMLKLRFNSFGRMVRAVLSACSIIALIVTVLTGFIASGRALLSIFRTSTNKVPSLELLKGVVDFFSAHNPINSAIVATGKHLAALFRYSDAPIFGDWLGLTLIWLAAIIASLGVRWFVLEFIGDVAIYLSSYRVSRFDEIRRKIQKVCTDVGRTVYSLKDTSGFVYDEVLVVGHSLGSVIAYDMLDNLINEDITVGNDINNQYKERTKLLLTFGSPLDKAAFVFRTQLTADDEVRAALEAGVQPLIADYKLRPHRWINIWSRADIISGELNYFDLPRDILDAPGRVENIHDDLADVPLFAHNQYWDNWLLNEILYQAARNPGPFKLPEQSKPD